MNDKNNMPWILVGTSVGAFSVGAIAGGGGEPQTAVFFYLVAFGAMIAFFISLTNLGNK